MNETWYFIVHTLGHFRNRPMWWHNLFQWRTVCGRKLWYVSHSLHSISVFNTKLLLIAINQPLSHYSKLTMKKNKLTEITKWFKCQWKINNDIHKRKPTDKYFFSLELDPCDGITCTNGGQCIDGSCVCQQGYTGQYCETGMITDGCVDHVCPHFWWNQFFSSCLHNHDNYYFETLRVSAKISLTI